MIRPFAPVAQLDRVPDYESGGRTFESYRARHTQKEPHPADGAFLYSAGAIDASIEFAANELSCPEQQHDEE